MPLHEFRFDAGLSKEYLVHAHWVLYCDNFLEGFHIPFIHKDLNAMLDERGRELYWESSRRQDLIRFGKYLLAWQEKPADAGTKNLLFPIPSSQLAVNPNLEQNPGY